MTSVLSNLRSLVPKNDLIESIKQYIPQFIKQFYSRNPFVTKIIGVLSSFFICRQLFYLRNRIKRYPPEILGTPFIGSLVPMLNSFPTFF